VKQAAKMSLHMLNGQFVTDGLSVR